MFNVWDIAAVIIVGLAVEAFVEVIVASELASIAKAAIYNLIGSIRTKIGNWCSTREDFEARWKHEEDEPQDCQGSEPPQQPLAKRVAITAAAYAIHFLFVAYSWAEQLVILAKRSLDCGYCFSVVVSLVAAGQFSTDIVGGGFAEYLLRAFLVHRISNWWHVGFERFKRGMVMTYDFNVSLTHKAAQQNEQVP